MNKSLIFYCWLALVTLIVLIIIITEHTNQITLGWLVVNVLLIILLIEYSKDTQTKRSGLNFLTLGEILISYIATICMFEIAAQPFVSNISIMIFFILIDGISLIAKYGFEKTIEKIHPRQHF